MEEDGTTNNDSARFIALHDAERTEQQEVFNLFRAALRTGDPNAVTAFVTRHGYRLGSGAEEGMCERIVLEEAMFNEGGGEPTLQMIGLFFRELGGRFTVSLRLDVCVFSLLIQIDHTRWIRTTTTAEEEEANARIIMERWSARMAEIVRYLVEELRMPIRMPGGARFRVYSFPYGPTLPLMQLARDTGAWSAYCAFGQYCSSGDLVSLVGLIENVLRVSPPGTVAYWARHFGIRTLSDDALQHLLVGAALQHLLEAQTMLTAEIQLRTDERVYMRALVMIKARDNAWAREVLESADIGRLIHTLAWKDARF